MQIKTSKKGTTLIVSIIGDLDHHSASQVRDKVDGQLIESSTKNMVIDLDKLTFMDSSGIGVILGRYKRISQLGGKALLVNSNSHIMKILQMSGMLSVIKCYSKLDEAIDSINKEAM